MLSCRKIAEHASDHVDRKLSFSESLGYGFHLLLCGYCRKFVQHLRTTIDLSQRLAEEDQLSDEEAAQIAQQTLERMKDSKPSE